MSMIGWRIGWRGKYCFSNRKSRGKHDCTENYGDRINNHWEYNLLRMGLSTTIKHNKTNGHAHWIPCEITVPWFIGFRVEVHRENDVFFYGNLTSSNCKNVMIAFTTPRSPWAKSAGKTRYVFVGSIPIVLAGLVGRREVRSQRSQRNYGQSLSAVLLRSNHQIISWFLTVIFRFVGQFVGWNSIVCHGVSSTCHLPSEKFSCHFLAAVGTQVSVGPHCSVSFPTNNYSKPFALFWFRFVY